MNETIKQQWIEALESGNIPQGQRFLGFPTGERCCLGVLCDLAVADGVIPEPVVALEPSMPVLQYGMHAPFAPDDRSVHALPQSVYEWAGLHGSNPAIEQFTSLTGIGYGQTLAEANDQGYDFLSIAAIIREQL